MASTIAHGRARKWDGPAGSGVGREQVIAVADAEVARCAVVALQESGKAGAARYVPRPSQVRDSVSVGPGHIGIQEGVLAIVFTDLAGDEGHRVDDLG